MTTDKCNHRNRVRLDENGRTEYLCVRCLDRWTAKQGVGPPDGWEDMSQAELADWYAARNGKVKKAPKGWEEMDQGELAVWYARNVKKADLRGHGRT